MIFDKIYIIGCGSICVNILDSLKNKGLTPCALIFDEHKLSTLSWYCKKQDILSYAFSNKSDLTSFLTQETSSCLIISANNNYLFPEDVVMKKNLKIINFHNALLPKHKGRNAQIWTIFEQDDLAGITWHMVNKNVDDGSIIIQKSIPLTSSMTALSLTHALMNLAFDAYKQIEDKLLNWDLNFYKMPKNKYPIHLSKNFPNNGFLDPNWNFDKKLAFMKAMDMGRISDIPLPKIRINDKVFIILKYSVKSNNSTPIHDEGEVLEIPSELTDDILVLRLNETKV